MSDITSSNNPWRVVAGVSISCVGSAVNAIGMNLQRRDHIRNNSLPPADRKTEFKRPIWVLGITLYVGSQLFASTLSLLFLQPSVVAPLGAVEFIFNFIFAYLLVGTMFKVADYVGTLLIVVGVVLIAYFGDLPKQKGDIDTLIGLYQRTEFICYFVALVFIIVLVLCLSFYVAQLAQHPAKHKESYLKNMPVESLDRICGLAFAVAGGMVASLTVILAETGVKLISETAGGDNQFDSYEAYIIIIILLITAFLQVYCLNAGLKRFDTVTIVPVFFSFYSIFALVNTNIYYNQWSKYEAYEYALIVIGIAILIAGVSVLCGVKHTTDGAARVETDEERIDILNGDDGDNMELLSTNPPSPTQKETPLTSPICADPLLPPSPDLETMSVSTDHLDLNNKARE